MPKKYRPKILKPTQLYSRALLTAQQTASKHWSDEDQKKGTKTLCFVYKVSRKYKKNSVQRIQDIMSIVS